MDSTLPHEIEDSTESPEANGRTVRSKSFRAAAQGSVKTLNTFYIFESRLRGNDKDSKILT